MIQACVLKRPKPVLSLFKINATQKPWESSKPDGKQTARVTENLAGGLALSHAALHDSRSLQLELTDIIAWQLKEHNECKCLPRDCAPWTRK